MFRTSLLTILVFLFLIGTGLVFFVAKSNHQDELTYQKLEENAVAKQDSQSTYSQQKREGICKEVFYQQGKEKLHFRILSDYSTLFLFHENNQMEVVEEMEDVHCYMQEELFYLLPDGREAILNGEKLLIKKADPLNQNSWVNLNTPGVIPMQIVRYMEAEKACYNYNTHLFTADDVKLWRYRLKGHELIISIRGLHPIMSGIAKNVSFSLNEKLFHFTAQQFKATFETTTAGGL